MKRSVDYAGIYKRFQNKFVHLKKKGLKFNGVVEIDYVSGANVIYLSHPFVFDCREFPETFEGVGIRSVVHGALPQEFHTPETCTTDEKGRMDYAEYGWAPERFEDFVDRAGEEIRKELGNDTLTREEMLDALCFGDFEKHKEMIKQSVLKGEFFNTGQE